MDNGSINLNTMSLAASLTSTAQPAERLAETRQLIHAVRAINGAEVFGQNQELTFVMDRDTKKPLLRIVDRKTGEVIAQVPPEHVLRLAREVVK
ncbi:MAG: flagellar protein FlaG [Acidobacteria bacterium]|nr:flagellar protein FlaG [Acidobacteriota bacterium]